MPPRHGRGLGFKSPRAYHYSLQITSVIVTSYFARSHNLQPSSVDLANQFRDQVSQFSEKYNHHEHTRNIPKPTGSTCFAEWKRELMAEPQHHDAVTRNCRGVFRFRELNILMDPKIACLPFARKFEVGELNRDCCRVRCAIEEGDGHSIARQRPRPYFLIA